MWMGWTSMLVGSLHYWGKQKKNPINRILINVNGDMDWLLALTHLTTFPRWNSCSYLTNSDTRISIVAYPKILATFQDGTGRTGAGWFQEQNWLTCTYAM
jgi:hypothetical protein